MTELFNQTSGIRGQDTLALAGPIYGTAIGALFFNIQPVLVGAIADTFPFDEQQLGNLVSIGLFAAFAGLASSFFWVTRVDWHRCIGIGVFIDLVAMIVLFNASSYVGVAASTALVGFGMALIYAPCLVALATSADPTRSFGFAVTAMVLLAGASVLLIPAVLMPRWGLQGVAVFLAALFAVTFVVLPGIPHGKGSPQTSSSGLVKHQGLAWLGLAAMAVFFIGVNSNWAFFELIGGSLGFDDAAIGYALAVSLLLGALGSAAASITSNRVQTATALTIGVVGMLIYVVVMRSDPDVFWFAAALIIFNVAWNYTLPFQMDIVAEADGSGRYVALLPASQTVGGAIGPILAGPLLMSVGADVLYVLLLVCVVVSALMFALARQQL